MAKFLGLVVVRGVRRHVGGALDCELSWALPVLLGVVLSFFLLFFFLSQKQESHAAHGARAGEPTAEMLGNPSSLNMSHWAARGPQSEPVDQRRVLIGSALLVGVAFVLFNLMRVTRGDTPKTVSGPTVAKSVADQFFPQLSKEWEAASAKRHRDRQMQPIGNHKVGAKVQVYEPSIVEGKD